METRVCYYCGIEKPLTNEYYAWANKAKGKYQTMCKSCFSEYMRKRNEEIKLEGGERLEKIKNSKKKYVENNKEKEAERQRIKERKRHQQDPEKYNQRRREWYQNNKDRALESAKKYRENNKPKIADSKKKYRQEHAEEIKEYNRRTKKERYHSDPLYHFICRVRGTLNDSFTRYETYKPRKNKDVIGMSSVELREYLLKTFELIYGYPWDLKEPVHIDHIVPLSTAKTEDDVIKLCHYSNLRLLKAKDNVAKGTKLEYSISN